MNARRHPLQLAAAPLLAALFASAPAAADTVIVADPSAQNITSYGESSAWSRRAEDGSYRLVTQRGDGPAADAAVRPSSVPFDADLGPTIATGVTAVYSRCATGSRRRDCDVYSYNLDGRFERRVDRISSRHASEIAPSQFKGEFAFARTGPGGGLFLRRHGAPTRRVAAGRFDETDLSAVRVIARGHRAINTFVGIARFKGRLRQVRTGRVDDNEPTVVTSPVLARYRAYWLQKGPSADPNARSIVETVSVRSDARRVSEVDRAFAPGADAIGLGSRSWPQLYSGPAGVTLVDPFLTFAP